MTGLFFEKDVPIRMSDGAVLRANVFRPDNGAPCPVIMALGPYGKDVHFREAFAPQWAVLKQAYPDLDAGVSSGRYLRWETVDPERWVPDGYCVIHVDARGLGKSPGYYDPFSPRERLDYYEAIEWAGTQSWCSGKVGLIGVSYYAISQWQVAALRPPHLAAIIPWEGGSDLYRDWSRHGGVLSNTFLENWWQRGIVEVQNGNPNGRHRDPDTGEGITGSEISDQLLAGNRTDHLLDILDHPLDDAWFQSRSPRLEDITVPVLSAGNWGGAGVHLRGNVEAFMRVSSEQKWLSMHLGTHFESFYLPEYVAMQKRFFDCFLKGRDNGWLQEPQVRLEVRMLEGTKVRRDVAFPIAGTEYQCLYLGHSNKMSEQLPLTQHQAEYACAGDGLTFMTEPFIDDTEFTGFVSAKLNVVSSSTDLDLFLTVRLFDPAGNEVTFTGAHEPVPVTRGWLRASHRRLDENKTRPDRPFHSHLVEEPLEPGKAYEVMVELWPMSIVVPKGYQLGLTVAGTDFELNGIKGRILHNHPADRAGRTDGTGSILCGGESGSCLMLPRISADA